MNLRFSTFQGARAFDATRRPSPACPRRYKAAPVAGPPRADWRQRRSRDSASRVLRSPRSAAARLQRTYLSQQARAEQALAVAGIPHLQLLISFAAPRLAQQALGFAIALLGQTQAAQTGQPAARDQLSRLESLSVQSNGLSQRLLGQIGFCLRPDRECPARWPPSPN